MRYAQTRLKNGIIFDVPDIYLYAGNSLIEGIKKGLLMLIVIMGMCVRQGLYRINDQSSKYRQMI